ncbi:GntR family transcriptional regulator [Candidatus Woesearchaeota archaeon]|nr:GntR family transcriptional regulator [Candidatus Woesearchaeota archaeon]
MDMYKSKWTRLQAQIFRFFCIKTGQTLSLRGIAKYLKVSPTAVSNSLIELEREGLIKVKKSETMNLSLIEFNRNNYKAVQLKRVENLKMVYESGLVDFLYNEFPGCTIVLFGSYSLGEDIQFGEKDERSSDIDIAIIGIKGKEVDLAKYGKLLERNISINFYKSWDDIHKHLKENILKGIILGGGIEL